MEGGVADAVLDIAVVHIDLLGGAAGPEAVHFENFVSPVVRDAMRDTSHVFLHGGIRHVQTGAAPSGVVGFTLGVFDKPILLIFEMRIIVSSGEGHEPDAGDKAEI